MRVIQTQHYTTEHQELFDMVSTFNKKYADEMGYDYISNNTRRCPERSVWWEKIAWLRELLSTVEDGALVVYQDCDSLNISGDIKLALGDSNYGMVQMRHGFECSTLSDWFNAGVIFMINSAEVREYFENVWNRNDNTDERSMNKELSSRDWIIGDKSIKSLNVSWNCWSNNQHLSEKIHIKSWHGVSYAVKLADIKTFINES